MTRRPTGRHAGGAHHSPTARRAARSVPPSVAQGTPLVATQLPPVRQQLREWCYEAVAKRGDQRQTLAVEACSAPLLCWGLHWWPGPQLALALDATTLGDRFAVLASSVR